MDAGRDTFVPVYSETPPEWDDARGYITETFKRLGNTVNTRESGSYVDVEVVNGQQFVPGTGRDTRSVFRKVVKFGALPNAAIKRVAHGIATTANTRITRIYAAATQPGFNFGIPIPYVDVPGGQNISLIMDATYVYITTAANLTAYTDTYVVIEYVQEA